MKIPRATAVLALLVFSWASSLSTEDASAYAPVAFIPPYSAVLYNWDSDSIYDGIRVFAGIHLVDPGRYIVVAQFFQVMGTWMAEASTKTPSSPGDYYVYIDVYGGDLYDDHRNGTYYVQLGLYTDPVSNSSTPIATTTFIAGSFTYDQFISWDEFQNPSHLEGSGDDYGLDTDMDGLYEYLVLETQVDVMVAGEYGLFVWVSPVMDNTSGPLRVIVNLSVGLQTVEIRCNGELFVNSVYEGPYQVGYVLMDPSFSRWYWTLEYWTASYSPSEFSGTAAAWFSGITDETLDVNGDGAMEYVAVYANITVMVPGTYNVSGNLTNPTLEPMPSLALAWNETYLGPGNWSVTLLFSGETFMLAESNHPYRTIMSLLDENETRLQGCDHYLNYYDWIVFAKPPVAAAVATPSGDGLTNFTLNASASSVEGGIFEVRWDFDDDGIWDTNWSLNQTVEHEFPGPGNYTVILEVRDQRGLTNQSILIVTITQEDTPPPPHARLIAASILPQMVISVAIIISVCIVVILIAWPIESLLVALMALLLPLYSRLRNEDVLDNYRRGMIHGLLLAHPGISFTDMKGALKISNGSLVYHLNILQQKGLVCCRRSGAFMRYYLNGSPMSELIKLGLTDFQLEIVKHVLSKGEATKQDIQANLKASKQTLHYNLKKLVTDGVLTSSHSGVRRTYKVDPGTKTDFSRVLGAMDATDAAREKPIAKKSEESPS